VRPAWIDEAQGEDRDVIALRTLRLARVVRQHAGQLLGVGVGVGAGRARAQRPSAAGTRFWAAVVGARNSGRPVMTYPRSPVSASTTSRSTSMADTR
jgi:hypothetical protein